MTMVNFSYRKYTSIVIAQSPLLDDNCLWPQLLNKRTSGLHEVRTEKIIQIL